MASRSPSKIEVVPAVVTPESSPKSTESVVKEVATSGASHPPYNVMVMNSISALKDRNGSSRRTITNYILLHYTVGPVCDLHVNFALKRLKQQGKILQMVGSKKFKINKVKESGKEAAKPAVKKNAAEPKMAKKTGSEDEKEGAKKASKFAKRLLGRKLPPKQQGEA